MITYVRHARIIPEIVESDILIFSTDSIENSID